MKRHALFRCYLSFVRPLLEYANILIIVLNKKSLDLKFCNMQNASCDRREERDLTRIVIKIVVYAQCKIEKHFKKLIKLFSINNHQCPSYLEDCFCNLSGGEH